ncbi:MAG TPA: divalent metal cation transporter [Chitinophagaceae bacterium]|nr:divalent metal cation transporter [Chitinophagaceae bacterium]HQX95518.1 divalent metal cation transporter [Chitinophagaceae bacterium]HRA10244.1 divalent metal cation transporter [Chitinophagaceae bacterium]
MKKNSAILGAAFLMATSAIGPGFLTQTSLFTEQLLTSFGFVILISILLDIGAQLNIWRIVAVSENRAQDIANKVFPGLGFFLAALIAFGGLVFNIGNIAGAGLGLNVLTGIDSKIGAIISCVIALGIFWYKEAGKLIDNFVKLLGLIMIGLTIYIAFTSNPPVGEALYRTIWPEKIDVIKIVTLVGGTVGGYISFAGAHRLIDAGIKGKGSISQITRSSVSGILITSLMRFMLFFAALGVVSQGIHLATGNPAASVFQSAAGELGYKFFGIVLWSAAITSVIGASFTSVSFWKTLIPAVRNNEKIVISCFILLSTAIFVIVGNPVKLLIFAGAVNGIILPIALAVILIAANKQSIMQQYKHPLFLQIIGWLVVAAMTWMSAITIQQYISKL